MSGGEPARAGNIVPFVAPRSRRLRAPLLVLLWWLLGVEALVNVMYMASRSAAASAPGAKEVLSTGMKIAYAGHGLLSLLAYLIFVVLGVLAYQEQRAGRWFFPERPALTWSFLVLWVISIGSGEVIFSLRYLV